MLLLLSVNRLDLVAEIPEGQILTRPLFRSSASSSYLPIPGWAPDSAFVLDSVIVQVQVSLLTIDTAARPPELAEAFGAAASGPCGS